MGGDESKETKAWKEQKECDKMMVQTSLRRMEEKRVKEELYKKYQDKMDARQAGFRKFYKIN